MNITRSQDIKSESAVTASARAINLFFLVQTSDVIRYTLCVAFYAHSIYCSHITRGIQRTYPKPMHSTIMFNDGYVYTCRAYLYPQVILSCNYNAR